MNCSLPGSSVHGISQARILELVPFPSPGDLPDPRIEPVSLHNCFEKKSLHICYQRLLSKVKIVKQKHLKSLEFNSVQIGTALGS